MQSKGWLRLWIVATVVGIPLAAIIQFNSQTETWKKLDRITIEQCVEEEGNNPSHPDALRCGHERGADATYFQHEHTAPSAYWSESLGLLLILDCLLSAMIVAVFFVVRWVVRGFGTSD